MNTIIDIKKRNETFIYNKILKNNCLEKKKSYEIIDNNFHRPQLYIKLKDHGRNM